ncbi:MAG TPA: hypothetical protein VIY86_06005, partial [Pirellulaceae bacterium]
QFERQMGLPYLVLEYADGGRIRTLAKRSPHPIRVVDDQTAYIPLPPKDPSSAVIHRVALEIFAGSLATRKAASET